MFHVRRLPTLGLAAAVALTLVATVAPGVSAAGGTTRWVDNDGKAGPNRCDGSRTAAKSIQTAVDHSGANDTILVCPGTYRGNVLISGDRAGLTIRGTKPWKATLTPTQNPPTVAGELDMILIDQVDDVTVRGLHIAAPNETQCARVDVGIKVLGSTGARILENRLFASARQVGCGIASGIVVNSEIPPTAASETIPASAVVARNLITNFQVDGISAGYDANVDVQITDNTLHFYLRGGQNTASVSATSSRPAGGSSTGVHLYGPADALINRNSIESASDAPIVGPSGNNAPQTLGYGIAANLEEGTVTIRNNFIRRVRTGMFIQAIGSDVHDNVVRKTIIGLDTGHEGSGNSFRRNQFSGITNGILVSNDTSGNVFRHNTAHASDGYACEDASTGAGTGGTNDTWTDNVGNSSSPLAICPPAAE